jgi:hypothetical protein
MVYRLLLYLLICLSITLPTYSSQTDTLYLSGHVYPTIDIVPINFTANGKATANISMTTNMSKYSYKIYQQKKTRDKALLGRHRYRVLIVEAN